jgi:sirohydrochlorin cobaltochelatase
VTRPPQPKPALLLAAHGTRDPAGVAAFAALASRVEDLAGRDGTRVAGGFIELSEPALREAVAGLAAASPVPPAAAGGKASPAAAGGKASPAAAGGKASMVAVPLMLSAAGHAKGDIPAALARERARHPGLTWTYGRPLGPHPALLELLAARIAAVSGPDAPAVLLVGRGSTDPDANADVVKTARLLWEGRDYPLAETAFVSLARPDVTEGLERCRLLGARQIVVARYFLFPGVLPDRVAEQAAGYAAAHPGLDIRCADVLGDCDEIAALVYERYQEALSGDIRMNCDVCVYRIAMPGFEHRVGEPQHPHDHPRDHGHDFPHPHPQARAHG